MKEMLFLGLLFAIAIALSGCLTDVAFTDTSGPTEPVLNTSVFLEQTCDALNGCPQGFSCGDFLGQGPKCYPTNMRPCDILTCPATVPCVVGESYPIQVACDYSNKAGCDDYDAEQCPSDCVVCPPCPECSSITCQNESFCTSIGFDKDWYASVTPK